MPGTGDSKQTTDQSQQQSGTTSLLQNQNQSQAGTTSATKNPWENAMPTINGILGQLNPLISNSGLNANQTAGINQLAANGQAGNPYAGAIGNTATSLLNGGGATAQSGAVQGGFDQLNSRLSATADPNYSSLDNPQLKAALAQIQSDVGNSVNGQFAAAGRDMSGANQMAYGRGVSAGQAPLLLNQFNTDRANQQGAASTLYNAQNSTSGILSGMNQQSNANQGAGITAATAANDATNYGANQLLAAGNQQANIPIQQLGLLAQIGLPVAGLGGTATGSTSQNGTAATTANGTSSQQGTGTSTTTKNPSLLEQMGGWAKLGSSIAGFM